MARAREGLREMVLTVTGDGEACEYRCAGTEIGDAQVGGWSCAETIRTSTEGMPGK